MTSIQCCPIPNTAVGHLRRGDSMAISTETLQGYNILTGDDTITIDTDTADWLLAYDDKYSTINTINTINIEDIPNTLTLGNTVVTEQQLGELVILLDVLKEDPAFAEKLAVQIALNKIAK